MFRADESCLRHDRVEVVDAGEFCREVIAASSLEVVCDSRVAMVGMVGSLYSLKIGELSSDVAVLTRRVILATGPWRWPDGALEFVSHIPEIRVKRVAALTVESATHERAACLHFVDDDMFFLPVDRKRVLVSFYRNQWDVDPDECDGVLDRADREEGLERLQDRFPRISFQIRGGRSFCDGYTPDRVPRVLGGSEGFGAIVGGSGSGVRLSPGLASRVVSVVA